MVEDRAAWMREEIRSLLEGLPRNAFGLLKSERLRQIERIGISMTETLSPHDFALLKAEIVGFRKANERRLEQWRRSFGGS